MREGELVCVQERLRRNCSDCAHCSERIEKYVEMPSVRTIWYNSKKEKELIKRNEKMQPIYP